MSSTSETAPMNNATAATNGGPGINNPAAHPQAQSQKKAPMKFRPIDVCLFGPDRVFRFAPKDPVEVLEKLSESMHELGLSVEDLAELTSIEKQQQNDEPSTTDAGSDPKKKNTEKDSPPTVSDEEENEVDTEKDEEMKDAETSGQNEEESTEKENSEGTSIPIENQNNDNDSSASPSLPLAPNDDAKGNNNSVNVEKTPTKAEIKNERISLEGETNTKNNVTPPPTPPPSEVPPKPSKYGTKDPHSHLFVKEIGSLSNLAQQKEHLKEKIVEQTPNLYEKPSHIIDLQELRRISSQGIAQKGSHRSVAWRVLLGYLPSDTGQWEEVLNRDRTLYRNLVAELFVQPDHQQSCRRESMVESEGRSLRGRGLEKDGVSVRCLSTFLKNTDRAANSDENRSGVRSQPGLGVANNVLLSDSVGEGRHGPGDEGFEIMRVLSDDGVSNGPDEEKSSKLSNASDENKDQTDPSHEDDCDVNESSEKIIDVINDEEVPEIVESDFGDGKGSLREKLTRTPSDYARKMKEETNNKDDSNKTDDSRAENDAQKTADEEKNERPSLKEYQRASLRARSLYESVRGPGAGLTVEERRKLTSNVEKAKLQGKDAPVPVHTPELGEMLPARLREQWKQSGRDTSALANISTPSGGPTHMNALLVVDDQGYRPDGTKQRITVNDDPLNVGNESKWAQFFENAGLLDEIRKDVVRTHPDLHFFLEPEQNLGQRRYAALERILFVWAKLNKGVRYVQGMNEIVGTIYFVLANDFNEDWASEAEADTYFLFNTLMVEMRDIFVPDLDDADTGIQGRISNMMTLLSLHDPEVRCHLDDCGIDASFYSIRWLTTLLSREFLLPDTIRLWDSMFASTHKDNFLRYVCVTMVMITRDELLKSDFSTCLRLLQSYPPTNVDQLLEASRALWIYESQVTLACHKGGISLQQALTAIAPPPAIIMAYGLKGGITPDRSERMRQAGEKSLAAAKGVAKEASSTVATAGKSFFGNARGLWGEWRSGGDKKKDYKRR
mmetsp:Transcript_1287/g.2076  ORF Transcript_1287/g.2076 Transcript_1287/m.2076 type:complete len:1010 (-) Transcript_1287:196-3225(-)